MSTPATEPTHDDAQGTQEPQGQPDPSPDPQEPQGDPQDGGGGNSEAARYRRRLRDAEGERDTLAGRIETFQRREVHRLAQDTLAQPNDLFDVAGTQLADLLDDAGEVDPGRVTVAVAALLDSRPGLAVVTPPSWPDVGGGRRGEITPAASWSGLLSRR